MCHIKASPYITTNLQRPLSSVPKMAVAVVEVSLQNSDVI